MMNAPARRALLPSAIALVFPSVAMAQPVTLGGRPDLVAVVFAPRSVAPRADRILGVARTSVDRRFEKDVSGSLGVLCGLQEGADRKGGADARGSDPNGRFVGAKLRVAFR